MSEFVGIAACEVMRGNMLLVAPHVEGLPGAAAAVTLVEPASMPDHLNIHLDNGDLITVPAHALVPVEDVTA